MRFLTLSLAAVAAAAVLAAGASARTPTRAALQNCIINTAPGAGMNADPFEEAFDMGQGFPKAIATATLMVTVPPPLQHQDHEGNVYVTVGKSAAQAVKNNAFIRAAFKDVHPTTITRVGDVAMFATGNADTYKPGLAVVRRCATKLSK